MGAMEEERKLKNEKGSEIERQEDTLRKGGRERERKRECGKLKK